jgi:hypothetical protein
MVFKMNCAFAAMAVETQLYGVRSSENDSEFNSLWEWELGRCATSLLTAGERETMRV